VGPISLADFMDVCLAHPEHGYYMHAETAKIGKAGDFVTAPEISQMFGELLGVWTVATWEKLGLPGKGDQRSTTVFVDFGSSFFFLLI
jgi:SAM-dependent MidA family methyltransferase